MTSTRETVHGGDATLGAAVASGRASVRFVPDAHSDLARALGWGSGARPAEAITVDVLRIAPDLTAVNMVVLGVAPDRRSLRARRRCRVEIDGRLMWDDRATTVVVANGEYLRGFDVVPRGHPGDGRLEVHVHALGVRQRRRMRARLRTGAHLPHPGIRIAQGTLVHVRWDRPVDLEVDGTKRGRRQDVVVRLDPQALTLLP
jgi:hypothetical protein